MKLKNLLVELKNQVNTIENMDLNSEVNKDKHGVFILKKEYIFNFDNRKKKLKERFLSFLTGFNVEQQHNQEIEQQHNNQEEFDFDEPFKDVIEYNSEQKQREHIKKLHTKKTKKFKDITSFIENYLISNKINRFINLTVPLEAYGYKSSLSLKTKNKLIKFLNKKPNINIKISNNKNKWVWVKLKK